MIRTAHLGIDPGSASGALAAVDEVGNPLFSIDCNGTPADVWTQYSEALKLLGENEYWVVGSAAIERVHTMPKQGISSAGKFMENFGAWQGIILAQHIPHELPTPQAWMKQILAESGSSAAGALEYCKRRYPQLNWTRKKDHNRADALCLAEWARRKFQKV